MSDRDVIARLNAINADLLAALKEVHRVRLRQLWSSCPDCEADCTHGAEHDVVLAVVNPALAKAENQ